MVVVVPLPVVVTAPGFLVRVHDPEAGSPLKATVPVAVAQVGCVMVPTTGAVGVAGWAIMAISPEAGETHPAALVTVKV